MASGLKGTLLQSVHRLFGAGTVTALDEDELLARFVSRRDEAAFEALVARHGPMVFGVCRRVLRDPRDSEDAFQATFMILARRAGSIREGCPVGHWLYGVARRVALRLRAQRDRRHWREQPDTDAVAAAPASHRPSHDLAWDLDDELGRLPEKYRAPIVLCYLEGFTHEEAAERLQWPVGSVRGRLSRARELLRTRLIRRGLVPSAVVLDTVVVEGAVSSVLFDSTIQLALRLGTGDAAIAGMAGARVLALTQGVLEAMIYTKLKAAAVFAVAGFAATGVAVYAYQDSKVSGATSDRPAAAATAADVRSSAASRTARSKPRWPATELAIDVPALPGRPTVPAAEPPAPAQAPSPASAPGVPAAPGAPSAPAAAPQPPTAPAPPGSSGGYPVQPPSNVPPGFGPAIAGAIPQTPAPPAAPPPPHQPAARTGDPRDFRAVLDRTRAEVDSAVEDLTSLEASLSQRLEQVRADLAQLRAIRKALAQPPVAPPTRASQVGPVDVGLATSESVPSLDISPASAAPDVQPVLAEPPTPTAVPTSLRVDLPPDAPAPADDRISVLERKLDALVQAINAMEGELGKTNRPRNATSGPR